MPADSRLVPPPGWDHAHPPAAWQERLTDRSRGSTADRAAILHDLGWAALHAGELAAAGQYLEEGLALGRSQRAARPMTAALLVGLSAVDRVQGQFAQALHRGRMGLERAAAGPVAFHAALGLATLYRLDGQVVPATRYHYLARRDAAQFGAEHDVQALLDLVLPGEGRPDGVLLSPDIQARLVLQDAEQLLARDLAPLAPVDASPYALLDEGRTLPRVRAWLGLHLPAAPALSVRVVLRGPPGLLVSGRFVPLHGDGRTLALLAYLVVQGPTPWPVVADAVLDEAPRERLYGQIKYHLTRLRGMLGDERAVALRQGRLTLASHWQWSTDLGDAGPALMPGAPLGWVDDRD
jgi:hypothetical protein